jgi:hypothetical protein
MNFSSHHVCCFTVVPLFLWIHLWVKNRCLQHPCFKNLCKIVQASKNSDSNAQHFLWDLLTHSWFHSMLFALPGYQFPYTVMNRCLYLTVIEYITPLSLSPKSHNLDLWPHFQYDNWWGLGKCSQLSQVATSSSSCNGSSNILKMYSTPSYKIL